jgi:hypothetical protein
MIRYLCPTCRQVAKLPNAARLAFCPRCGQALGSFDRLFETPAKETMPTDRGAGQAYGARLPSG